MTAYHKLLWSILLDADKNFDEFTIPEEINDDNVEEHYEALCELGLQWDCVSELRDSGIETGLDSPGSRNYEAKEVAAKMPDGSWVGWTYWYGGGKHGNPDEIEWMEYAYDLDLEEKEELVLVKHWTKKGELSNEPA
jgi:hypothetical protein